MTIDDIQNVVNEFVKRFQLPESDYSFSVKNSESSVELIIQVNNVVRTSLSITNGSIRVIYSDNYSADNYQMLKFLTPVTLVYYLCVFFYIALDSEIEFNQMLSILFFNDIYDWRTLVQGISENLGMSYFDDDGFVTVDDVPLNYNGFLNQITLDTQVLKLQDSQYLTIVKAIFECVEYIANLSDLADKLFFAESYEEDNIIEEESEGEGVDIDIDMGDRMDFGGGSEDEESLEPVPPMDNETFEEPQSPVVEVEDII